MITASTVSSIANVSTWMAMETWVRWSRLSDPGLIVWLECPKNPLTDKWPLHLVDDQVHGIHGLLKGDVSQDGQYDLLATKAKPKEPFLNSLAWFQACPRIPKPRKPGTGTSSPRTMPLVYHITWALAMSTAMAGPMPRREPKAVRKRNLEPEIISPGGKLRFDPTQVWKKHAIANDQPGATNIHPADVNSRRRQSGFHRFARTRQRRGVV